MKRLVLGLATLTLGSLSHAAETNTIGMTLVPIEPGTFERGNGVVIDPDSPGWDCVAPIKTFFNNTRFDSGKRGKQTVEISRRVLMGATEVTVGQFRKFVEATGYVPESERPEGQPMLGFTEPKDLWEAKGLEDLEIVASHDYSWKNPGFEQTDHHPVVGITWNDAKAFCAWLSEKEGITYRLPTEAEWEYACMAGEADQPFWFGSDPREAYRYANIASSELEASYPGAVHLHWAIDPEVQPGDGAIHTAPVASYPANAWGLHDMHGNVLEWCEDAYSQTAYKEVAGKKGSGVVDPLLTEPEVAGVPTRVIRGGSFYNGPYESLGCARLWFLEGDPACYLGFRVVAEK